jgi:hypothetical protein
MITITTLINILADPHYVFLITTFMWLIVSITIIATYDGIIMEMKNIHNQNVNIIKSLKKHLRYYKKFQYLPRRFSQRLQQKKVK